MRRLKKDKFHNTYNPKFKDDEEIEGKTLCQPNRDTFTNSTLDYILMICI
jgi:hypothetical protein